MWTRLTLLLMLAVVSAKPAPEISLQEIEKELEELTAKEHDASETTVKKANQADTPKETKSDEAIEEEANHQKNLQNSAIDAKEKKEEEVEKGAETEKKKSDYLEIPPKKPVKPGPEEIPHRDATESEARNSRLLSQLSEEYKNDYPPLPKRPKFPEAPYRRTYGKTDYNEYDHPFPYPPVPKRPYFPEAPHRRIYDTYRKSYDYVPRRDRINVVKWEKKSVYRTEMTRYFACAFAEEDLYAPWDRTGFESNADQSAGMRGMPYDMTRAERMALLSGGKWLPDSRAVKVPAVLPPPSHPDVDTRSYKSFQGKMNDKETEDLIRGKEGLTETEKRKRLLTDLLAEKLKSKVSEAHKRGIEIPSKIEEFLWNYEARRTADTRSEKDRLSH